MAFADDPAFLRRRWAAPAGVRFGLRAPDGRLLAAGTTCPSPDGVIVTGLIDPSARGRGLGAEVLDRCLELAAPQAASSAAEASPAVTVETESLTEAAIALFTSRGLRQVFAEDVLRIEPAAAAPPRWPVGAELAGWSAATAGRFYQVYEAAFRDRPGFPGTPADEWIAENDADDEFRPGWSLLASVPDLGDAGFVTAAVGWIVQVGVRPAARGRGIGAALVGESLRRMAADGATGAWLDVHVDNPGAAALYRRLGFAQAGRRARFRR